MANRDILQEVSLQMENLKLSSPLRTEQNGDDNKENILGGQGIPKIKPEETTSCAPSTPVYTPIDQTSATQLNGAKINNINDNTHDKSDSFLLLPESKKSLHSSEVENSIPPLANLNETYNNYICHNEILQPTTVENGIELNVHLNGGSHEGENFSFLCEETNSENTLNSTFNVNAGVNLLVENLENSGNRESLNSTFNIFENKCAADSFNKNNCCDTQLGDELLRKKEDVLHSLNIIKRIDEKREVDEHESIDCLTLVDSKITLLVACAEENNLSSDEKSAQIQNFVDSQNDSLVDSKIADSCEDFLVITKKHSNLTCIKKENSEGQRIVLDDGQFEEVKLDNINDTSEGIKTNHSSQNRSIAELTDLKENIILLNNSSLQIATTSIPVDSKEYLHDFSASPPENCEKEIENCTDSENCYNNLTVPTNDQNSQTFNEILIEEGTFLNTPNIAKVANTILSSIESPQRITGTDNTPELTQTEIENKSEVSATEVENNKISYAVENCQNSEDSIFSKVTVQNSVPVIQDLTQLPIDDRIEFHAVNEVVDTFNITTASGSPQRITSTENTATECSDDLSQEDTLTCEEHSFSSDEEPYPNDVTVVNNSTSAFIIFSSPEPEECTADSKVTSLNRLCPSSGGFEENSSSPISCVEAEAETNHLLRIVKNTVEVVDTNFNSIDLHAVDESERVATVKVQKSIKEQSVLDKTSDIPKVFEGDVKKMAELSEKLQQEISDLKLELNASKQAKATLELEIGKKDEIILKTQAEAIRKEQHFQQEMKSLKEQLKEKSSINEKDSIKDLEEALKESRAKESQAVSALNARIVDELNYRKIMEEYEKTIAARIADSQKLKEENETVTRHLANLELSFSDLHQKYERTKTIIDGFKNNEEKLRKKFAIFEDTFHKQEEKYESLKAHAKAQIEKSNKEIIKYKEKYDSEVNKLNAIIKRLEIKSAALETSLDQKSNECIALAALCDEVTGKKV